MSQIQEFTIRIKGNAWEASDSLSYQKGFGSTPIDALKMLLNIKDEVVTTVVLPERPGKYRVTLENRREVDLYFLPNKSEWRDTFDAQGYVGSKGVAYNQRIVSFSEIKDE